MKVKAALSYARRGIPVFPVHWIEGGKCSCHKPDCGSRGKHPLIVGWQAEATADSAVINAWWGRYPNANIGVLTGKRSNITVADIDGDVGKDTLRDLESKNGELPDTPRVTTGSGGYHYYFQHEPELTNAVRFAPGLDIRTEGGFVVGAGSANARGRYHFEVGSSLADLQPAKMPQWLIDIAKNQNGNCNNAAGFKMSEEPVLEGEGRNNFLYRAGRSMHAKGYPEAAIRAALDETNRARCRPSVTPGEFESILESVLTGADRPDFQRAQEPREHGEIKTLTARALLELKIAPREFVLDPVLRERETAMLWAWRGTGKTYVGLAMAYAIASGGKVLRWSAPRSRRVLYVDGELPLQTVQERIAALVAGSELEPPSDDYFKIVTPDVQEMPLPNLSSREAQQALERVLGDVEVLFIDSISTLCRSGRENDSEDWLPVQEWALRLRQCGKTVVFVHHAGKGGSQRGTSRREDILDLSVRLARPQDYSPDEGARFEVHFEKARTILGDAVKPFEARLFVANGRAEWQMRDLEDAILARAVSLFQDGTTVRDAAEELKISKSAAQRLRNKAAERGMLSDAN